MPKGGKYSTQYSAKLSLLFNHGTPLGTTTRTTAWATVWAHADAQHLLLLGGSHAGNQQRDDSITDVQERQTQKIQQGKWGQPPY